MKTAAIITRHNVPNYGSVMQSYATEEVLRKLGWNPITIDYRRSEEESRNVVKRFAGRSLPQRLFRNTVWRLLWDIEERRFKSMREDFLTLSDSCSEEDIWRKLPDSDVYLTGSDQVWNELGDGTLDGAFFWDGVNKAAGKRIISYAASFGRETVTPGYEKRVGAWLSRYDAISVREDSGVGIAKSYGIPAVQVLDPTLLLEGAIWRGMASVTKTPKRPYALVYSLHPDSGTVSYVKERAASSGLDIVSVCPTFRPRVGRHVILPSLPEFLGLFANATCVYTDSFHGTALCINLCIPFVEVFPKENSARNKSVLRLFGLEGRASDVFVGKAWDPIDWEPIQSILSAEREKSMAWLRGALEGDLSC